MIKINFYKLCKIYTSNIEHIEQEWVRITQKYAQKGRYYHTLKHIEHLFTELKSVELIPATQFAIFYHDAVYDVLKENNEELSAVFAEASLKRLGVDNKTIDECKELIMRTKTDTAETKEQMLFLDADLSILGASSKNYLEYAKAIRKEYQIYSDKEYKEGRTKVLSSFLNRDRIYHSKMFYEKYEIKARENIKNEYNYLNDKQRV